MFVSFKVSIVMSSVFEVIVKHLRISGASSY